MSWGVATRNGLSLGLGNIPALGVEGLSSPGYPFLVISCDGTTYSVPRTIVSCDGTNYAVVRDVVACNGTVYTPI